MKKENNIAFIDAQNLHMGTALDKKNPWKISLAKFYIFLKDKYKVQKAYYFLGCVNNDYQGLYEDIQVAGFILKFREHHMSMIGKKKGNVDTDIVFDIMQRLYKKQDFTKILLVSGDGDYKKMVDFLIREDKFKKILFPNKRYASSLYKQLGSEYFAYLEEPGTKRKIEK